MPRKPPASLSRRERQIMDILFAAPAGVSVGDVVAALPDPPSYSSVRALLRVLEEKGHAKHKDDGVKYLYLPTASRTRAAKTALAGVLETFFAGSLENAVAAHLADPGTRLSPEDLQRLAAIIRQAKERGQ